MAVRLSVVIPAHNASRFLREACESALCQVGPDLELIVVDDGSTDGTTEVAEGLRDPRISLIRREHEGVSAARNTGAEKAVGELLLFLDADDLLLPGAVDRLVRALDRNPASVLAYGEIARRHGDGGKGSVFHETIFGARPDGEVLPTLLRRNFVHTGAACVRRRTHELIRGFRTDLRHAEDWEYWTRVALTGPFSYLPAPPLAGLRSHDGSSSRKLALRPAELAASIAAVFTNPKIVERLDAGVLRRYHRRHVTWSKAYLAGLNIGAGRWSEARRCLVAALSRDPLRPREWLLLAAVLARSVPALLRTRLG